MPEKRNIDRKDLEFLKDLFGGSKLEPKKAPVEIKKERKKPTEKCPHCGEMFVSLGRHLSHCEMNPDNIQEVEPVRIPSRSTKRKVYIEEEVGSDWSPVISELVPLIKNLSGYIKKLNDEPIKVQIVK